MRLQVGDQETTSKLKACWIGGTRYTNPLNPTLDAKWRALLDLNAELYVVGFAAGVRPQHFTQHAHFYLMPQFPTSILRYLEMYLLAPWLLLWLVFRHGVNVLVAQSPFEGAAGAFVKQVAGLFGKRVLLIVESHGDFEVALFTQRQVNFAGLYRWLMRQSAHYAFHHAHVLRAVSNSTHEQLERWSPGTPIEQFMAWIDFDAFGETPRQQPLLASWDIVYAGLLIPRKNVHILLDAFAQIAAAVPKARVWLVGKPENLEYTAQLKEQVERLGLTDRVVFVGAVPQAELAAYMARARTLVLVSSSEGLPRVVMEAMFGGLVVIGSHVSGIPDVIQDGVTGYLVPPGDIDALVEALRTVYKDAEINAMGARAGAFARQFFSREAYVEGYRKLLSVNLSHQQGATSFSARETIHNTPTDAEQTDTG